MALRDKIGECHNRGGEESLSGVWPPPRRLHAPSELAPYPPSSTPKIITERFYGSGVLASRSFIARNDRILSPRLMVGVSVVDGG